jgi:hypothetical protein
VSDNATAFAPDPCAEFVAIIREMEALHRRKSQDYGSSGDAYANFYDVARQMGWGDAWTSCEALIALKQARLRMLAARSFEGVANESVRDTLHDRAVYAVIALVLYDRGRSSSS